METDGRSITRDYIPEELQLEIFSWLPGKSLARFSCVCKLWDHSFISAAFLLHHSRSLVPSTAHYIIYLDMALMCRICLIECSSPSHDPNNNNNDLARKTTRRKGVVRVPLPRIPGYPLSKDPTISNICNDLVCLYHTHNNEEYSSILLFSPRLEDFLRLPRNRNPPNSSYRCCLGFDPIRSKYKVLRHVQHYQRNRPYEHIFYESNYEYEILTVGSSKSWKTLDHVPSSLHQYSLYEPSFCIDGIIYWLEVVWKDGICLIVSFNLMCEEFHMLDVQELVGCYYHGNKYYLTPLKGCATLFFRKKGNLEIEQWTLSKAVWTRSRIIATTHVLASIWDKRYFGTGSSICVDPRIRPSRFLNFNCYDVENNTHWVAYMPKEARQ